MHHHLVVKAHPLEDGRTPVRHDLRRLARAHGVAGRVHYVRGRQLLRQAVDMMLSHADPYDALREGSAVPRQQLRLVT